MRRRVTGMWVAAAVVLGTGYGICEMRGQNVAPAVPATVGQMLEEMRRENTAVLEQQRVMLEEIAKMREDARQTRIFAKRS